VLEYRLAERTGGAGRHRGGDGVIRTFQFLTETTLTLFTDRRRYAPYGLQGGKAGKRGQNRLLIGNRLETEIIKGTVRVPPGTLLTIRTPGGGGWGKPEFFSPSSSHLAGCTNPEKKILPDGV